MTHISTNAKALAVDAVEGSAETVSANQKLRKDTAATNKSQAPRYRCAKRGSNGQVLWVQGKPLDPVASPEQMKAFGEAHRRDEWRRQWQFPQDGIQRTPAEHRAALAALDAINAAPKSQQAALLSLSLDLLGGAR